ncbi:hypothetical protein [Natronobiforma cellulositropha]|uniref:hypothetical protein n=1 Tax=Natronobiforma cellulositropha TaxID=1679076 RepID=UPI0021D5D2C3|nr:hypothetical protein [Natronobiforma cellulositropha]
MGESAQDEPTDSSQTTGRGNVADGNAEGEIQIDGGTDNALEVNGVVYTEDTA